MGLLESVCTMNAVMTKFIHVHIQLRNILNFTIIMVLYRTLIRSDMHATAATFDMLYWRCMVVCVRAFVANGCNYVPSSLTTASGLERVNAPCDRANAISFSTYVASRSSFLKKWKKVSLNKALFIILTNKINVTFP